jgi:hypothetical protein
MVGAAASLGDSDALLGRGWSGDVATDHGRAVAAHAPIYADDGELLGLAVAEQTYPSIWERLTGAAPDLGLFLGIGALLGGAGTYVVSRVVKRRTRGLGPSEIATLADHREALLHAIREGVVAVGTDGRVTMMNDAARATLGLDRPEAPDPVAGPGEVVIAQEDGSLAVRPPLPPLCPATSGNRSRAPDASRAARSSRLVVKAAVAAVRDTDACPTGRRPVRSRYRHTSSDDP